MCLTRLLPLVSAESKIHKFMFWIALSILQLEETQLYASGLALLEQNLHTLDHMLSLFENTSTHQQQTLERIMMDAREPLEWQFKQLDASMGLSFKSNFNFALVGHLIKGKKQISKLIFHSHHVMDIVDQLHFYFPQVVAYKHIHSISH
jgi:neurofibromin 1